MEPAPVVTMAPIGPVAQSVEQRTENPCVGGSIPLQATNKINNLAKINSLGFFVCVYDVRADVRRFSESSASR